MPKLSVIIPVYNVEPYIRECLDSVLAQTFKDMEIICVDDGSSDRCPAIIDEYAQNDDRIKVIHQKNSGVVSARNVAIQIACGEYMAFLDSDDYISPDFYEKLLDCSNCHDLVTSGFYSVNSINCVENYDVLEKGVYSSDEELLYFIRNMIFYKFTAQRGITSYIWNKLFKTEIVKDIFKSISPEVTIAEDSALLYKYVLRCKSILITDICGYYYRYREGSAVNSINLSFLKNVQTLYDNMLEEFSRHQYSDELIESLQYWMSRLLRRAPYHLGFKPLASSIFCMFPLCETVENKKVILYGAGCIGMQYFNQLKATDNFDLVLWVDKSSELCKKYADLISPVNMIFKTDYDYIVLAVKNYKMADEIRSELIEQGVENNKILWKKPIYLK